MAAAWSRSFAAMPGVGWRVPPSSGSQPGTPPDQPTGSTTRFAHALLDTCTASSCAASGCKQAKQGRVARSKVAVKWDCWRAAAPAREGSRRKPKGAVHKTPQAGTSCPLGHHCPCCLPQPASALPHITTLCPAHASPVHPPATWQAGPAPPAAAPPAALPAARLLPAHPPAPAAAALPPPACKERHAGCTQSS